VCLEHCDLFDSGVGWDVVQLAKDSSTSSLKVSTRIVVAYLDI
jgi:hypothetical protein